MLCIATLCRTTSYDRDYLNIICSPFFNSWVPFIKDYLTKNLNKTVCKLITDQLADFDKTVSSIPCKLGTLCVDLILCFLFIVFVVVIPIGDVANLSYKLIGQPQFTSQHIMASVEVN